jgi:TIR domain/CHAT domain/AAA ATPase domain
MRVFISHSSKDKPAVLAFATILRQRGIDAWVDQWEIAAGDDIVAGINRGLAEMDAGIIAFSKHTGDSKWVAAEISTLIHARITQGKHLIPVMVDADAIVPPLVQPLCRRRIDEIDAIIDGLQSRTGKPPLGVLPERGTIERVLIRLERRSDGVAIAASLGGETHAQVIPALPAPLVNAVERFLSAAPPGPARDGSAQSALVEHQLRELGQALGLLCLPGAAGAALAGLIDAGIGRMIELVFEAEDPLLLGLPFEALTLPDGRAAALQPSVIVLRRPLGVAAPPGQPLAGPLKILVAAAAPDQDGSGTALDQERELQNILDAVEAASRLENCQVRILELAHPQEIGLAIKADAYHVLHLSCHGGPGLLELETEDGAKQLVTAAALLAPIKESGRPLPLILLNACHGGVVAGQTASLASDLLRGGVPAILVMQTSVSDGYAVALAKEFYAGLTLTAPEQPLPSRALAAARRAIEAARRRDPGTASALPTGPEYATATLYVAGEERALAEFGRDKEALRAAPIHVLSGPVPQLSVDQLIGRRAALKALDDPSIRGVALAGIGGVGKSALAGRLMCRLAEAGWAVAAHEREFDVVAIARAIGRALQASKEKQSGAGILPASGRDARSTEGFLSPPQGLYGSNNLLGDKLCRDDLDDRTLLDLIGRALATEPVLLVLDDFERNLTTGGDAFRDPDAATYFGRLLDQARRGRLLVTCRHPVPGAKYLLQQIAIGPLRPVDSRKLLFRLPALSQQAPADLAAALRILGGHLRIMELLDALLANAKGRIPHVTKKLELLADSCGVDLEDWQGDLDQSLATVLHLGAGDILLEELLDLAGREDIGEALLQVAISNLPVTPEGLARLLAGDGAGDIKAARQAMRRLEALSLFHRIAAGAWVHRWTAELLARQAGPDRTAERCRRAGRYRLWRVEHESHAFEDAQEAVRNFLAAGEFDAATSIADLCFQALKRAPWVIGIASLAAEILDVLPIAHPAYAWIADEEAQSHLALGSTDRALQRYQTLLDRHRRLAAAEPGRADYQRDLIVSCVKLSEALPGDARKYLPRALEIASRLRTEGRLAPTDHWMIDDLGRRLASLS